MNLAAATAAIRRMEAAGYRLETDGGTLHVAPADTLNEVQRNWLRQHKPELLAALAALAIPDVRRLVEMFDAEVMAFEEHSEVAPADSNAPPPVFTT